MSLNNLQSIGDDEAITEIDFDSFLNGSDNDFFSDVDKVGANAHKMDEQLQSVLNDTVDSADVAVSKSSGVRTGFFRHADEKAEGISGLWENPEDYIDEEEQEETPDDTVAAEENGGEDVGDADLNQENAENEPEADFEFDEDFERETGLFDIKRDMANLLSQLHESVADDDAAFNAILYEIESNDAIVPTEINISADEIAAQSDYTEVAAVTEVDEEAEEPEYSQYLLVDEETSVAEQQSEITEGAVEETVAVTDEGIAEDTADVAEATDAVEENDGVAEEIPVAEDEESEQVADESDTDEAQNESEQSAAVGVAVAAAATAVAVTAASGAEVPVQAGAADVEESFENAEFEDDIFVNPFDDDGETVPETVEESANESDDGKFIVTIPDDGTTDEENVVVNEGTQPLIYYKADETALPETPVADNAAANEADGKKSKKDKNTKKEKKEKKETVPAENGAAKSKHSDTPRKIVFVTAIITIIVCVGYLANAWIIEPMRFKSQSTELSDVIVNDVVEGDSPEEIWNKIKQEHPDVDFPENMLPSYANVYAMNTDLAGWITIDGLDINLPVAQGTDNRYYLYRDIKKNKTKYGVPYFDARNSIDTLDKNTIVYGHNMRRDDLIFGMLEEYRTIEGWRKAPVVQCNTIYGNYSWKVYAVYLADGKTDSEGYFFNYVFTNISDESFAGYIREIDKRKFYTTGVDIEPTDKILTLSTCCYDFNDARLVVVARLVREGESVAVNTAGAYVNENPKYPLLWYKANGKENIAYKDDEKWRA